jgi:hypothetical protein
MRLALFVAGCLFACAGTGCGGPTASAPPTETRDASLADGASPDARDSAPADGASPEAGDASLADGGSAEAGDGGGADGASPDAGDGSPADGAPPDAGDAAPGTLDCNWVMDAGNCFQAPLAAAATDCAVGADGTLSADGTKCTFPTGEVVNFATPLMNDGGGAVLTGFSLDTDGDGTCLAGTFSADGNSSSIVTAAGTISVAYQPSTQTILLTCPSGATYAGDAASLDSCSGLLPGLSTTSSGGPLTGRYLAIAVGLAGTGMSQNFPIFNCYHP